MSYTEVRAHQAPPSKKQMYAMQPNTLTKPYQGRTYRVTLSNGHEAVITVEAGYTPGLGGEIARLHQVAEARWGLGVESAEIFAPTGAVVSRGAGRWWAVELKTLTETADIMSDGSYDFYQLEETDHDLVQLDCPGQIPVIAERRYPGWVVTDFAPSNGPIEIDEEIPW